MNLCGYYRVFIFIILYPDLLNADELVLTGSSAELKCPYQAQGSNNIVWNYIQGSETVYLAENDYINTALPTDLYRRISVSGNHNIGEYHLNISDIRKTDEGRYECSILTKIKKVILTVIDGPTSLTIENVTPNKTLPGLEGQNTTIKCIADGGHPPPDIKLVILGSLHTGKQSAKYTFQPIRANDGSTVTCQAGYEQINHYPLKIEAHIYLKFKPVITPFTISTLSTEETKSFEIPCKSTGSRPAASMYWLLDQHNITSNSSSKTVYNSGTDTYAVTSNLRYRVDRRYNGEKLKCGASNVAGNIEASLTLNVKYAPGVTVENKTFSQTQTTREIPSTVDSNPAVNNCTWQHKSTYGENIRDFSDNNQTLTLPTVPEDQRYQDTGEYVCTAENAILGINGQFKQTGSGYLISNAPPVITADNKENSTQYGKFKKNTELKVNVFSIPKFSGIRWYVYDTQLVSDKYAIKEEPAIVKDVFHGVEVQVDGYRVTLTISDLQEADFTNYTLRLEYGTKRQYVEYEVTLESASAPETPSNFTTTGSGETSITVQWIPGYDGGQKQIFYIEYRITGSRKWKSHEIKTIHQIDTQNLYNLQGLQDKTSYELRMYAKNNFNQSQHTDIETRRTLEKANSTALGGVIGGVAGGLVLVIVILILIAFVLFKRKTGSGFSSKMTRSHSDSEVEEGLKDNVLYEGSDTEGLKANVLYHSAGPESIHLGPNAEYAEVSKPAKKPSKSSNTEYAEVQKQNDVYAEVDKKAQQKNVKKKKQKEKKKPPKAGQTKDGALNNNPDGEYSNSGIPMGNMSDGAYSNAENQSTGNKKNDQGLEYADLTFGSKIPTGKQPVIHGDENRTIYSEVDHTKKAPPPPQESEYEETDIRHGKK